MRLELRQKALESPWNRAAFSSVYFGGGTPSILSIAELSVLLETIHELYALDDNLEVTIEVNPDDITSQKLAEWRSVGINRLSLGVQSFVDEELAIMNRAHNSDQAIRALETIAESNFTNLSVDLIYGMPGSTLQSWADNLYKLDPYPITHLSAYTLTVEPRTALEKSVKKGLIELPSEECIIGQYQTLRSWTHERRFEHYELSNFAKGGYMSSHNSHYWTGEAYLGIGPGAHSFDGVERWWNVSNNSLYAKGQLPEREMLAPRDRINEKLMTKLRTAEGFNWSFDLPSEQTKARELLFSRVKTGVEQGHLSPKPFGFSIRPEHWMRSDQIISDLFILESDLEEANDE
jgi:oxygen-independent coproporphyrinogen-3 oxidase